MNENLNLVKILKDCPKGTKLYSPMVGEVEFNGIDNSNEFPLSSGKTYPIDVLYNNGNSRLSFTENGLYYIGVDDECMLFPSKDQRDWSKFQPKKPKFDPKTLLPFDRVLIRTEGYNLWSVDLFSFIGDNAFKCIGGYFKRCVPYNEETKHLVGTTEEAPEYYRYWED